MGGGGRLTFPSSSSLRSLHPCAVVFTCNSNAETQRFQRARRRAGMGNNNAAPSRAQRRGGESVGAGAGNPHHPSLPSLHLCGVVPAWGFSPSLQLFLMLAA